MRESRSRLLLSLSVLCLLPAVVKADGDADEKLFQSVMKRLMNNEVFVREYPDKFAYPPKAYIKPKSSQEMNAYASAHRAHGAEVDAKSGKIRPVVMITQGFMDKIVCGDEHSLAVIMGHELAHLTKDHVSGIRKGESAIVTLSFGRDDEIEADLNGMRYAISAGYPYRKGVAKSFTAMRANTKYSSFEGLSSTHPSWEDRLIFLDREQSKLWSAMSAYRNGQAFLEMEQYLPAQQCFKAVTSEFPDCYEAWANLGYAKLMQYCDGFDYDDLKRMGIGQIVTGGFYSRPDSLEAKVRGIDEKLWKDAVKSLQKALDLKADLVLPRASLGVAYLVHPEGKDVKAAKRWFATAFDRIEKDPELSRNAMCRAALLVNAGVADMAGGDMESANRRFQEAEDATAPLKLTQIVRSIEDAVAFNRSILWARSKNAGEKQRAFAVLESYLKQTQPDSAWWPLAYSYYGKVGKDIDRKVMPRVAFFRKAAPQDLRTISTIKVGTEIITLSEPTTEAVGRIGKDAGEPIPLYPDSKIMRWRFVEKGIDLLAKDKVLAIFLTSKKSPPVVLQQVGLAGNTMELKIGMSESVAKDMLKDQRTDGVLRTIADGKTAYHFYPNLGLAVRYANAHIEEMAIAQMPRRPIGN